MTESNNKKLEQLEEQKKIMIIKQSQLTMV